MHKEIFVHMHDVHVCMYTRQAMHVGGAPHVSRIKSAHKHAPFVTPLAPAAPAAQEPRQK